VHAPCKAPAFICTPSSDHRIRGSTAHVTRTTHVEYWKAALVMQVYRGPLRGVVDMHAAAGAVHALQYPLDALPGAHRVFHCELHTLNA
jgi:hypothetical protein